MSSIEEVKQYNKNELQTIISEKNAKYLTLGIGVIGYVHEKHEDDDINLDKVLSGNNVLESIKDALSYIEKKYYEFNGLLKILIEGLPVSQDRNLLKKIECLVEIVKSYELKSCNDMQDFINKICLDSYVMKTPESIIKILTSLYETNYDVNKYIEFADFCAGTSQAAIKINEIRKENEVKNIFSYYGNDINSEACAISRILMVINQIENSEIVNHDLLADNDDNNKFDLIFADIPQAMAWNNQNAHNDTRFKYGIPNKLNADWAFYQNIIYHLKENGLAIATGTKGALARSIDKDIRKNIIEEDLIEAVVSLPANLYENTGIEIELIIFNKNKSEKRKNTILFINARDYRSRLSRNKAAITDEGIEKIIKIYKEGIEEIHFSKFISYEKLKEYGYTLNSNEYLEFDELKNTIDNSILLESVAHVTRGVQISKSDMEILSKEPTHYLINVKDIEDGKINYDETVRITNKKPDWIGKFDIKADDIIITSKGSAIKMAIVNNDYKPSFVSGNLAIIRVGKNKYNPYVLYEFLQSEVGSRMLEGVQVGTTVKLLNPSQLYKINIPAFDIDFMNEIGEKIKNNKITYEKTVEKAEAIFEENKMEYKKVLNF